MIVIKTLALPPSVVLGIALAIVAGIGITLLIKFLLRVRVRSLARREQIERQLRELASAALDLKARLGAVDERIATSQQGLAEQLQRLNDRFPADARLLLPEHLDGVAAALRGLRDEIVRLELRDAAPVAADNVALEREVLGESWRKFCKNEELSASFDHATKDEEWKQVGDPLLTHLPSLVPDDLKSTFEAVLAPAREYNRLVEKISVIPKIVNGEFSRLEDNAQELARTREYAQLLAMSLNSSFVSDRLNFRLKSWVIDHFLTFADLYLQRYQQARLENGDGPSEEGVAIVKSILRVAAVEPIDVTLGETPFDSTRHIGRSTASDARFSDGVIVGVIRNGFVEGGKQVIRQPEVVVNRTR